MTLHKAPFIRLVSINDVKSVYALSKQAKRGLTNLPKTMTACKQVCRLNMNQFPTTIMFGLDNGSGTIIGLSAIKPKPTRIRPNVYFSIDTDGQYPYLKVTNDQPCLSELGSLFLSPHYRQKGLSRLLSLCRFLFIRSNQQVFTSTIIAALRGFFFRNNRSPVYDGLAKCFLNMPFKDAEAALVADNTFLQNHFPTQPIYLNLLSANVRHYIGQVHPFTEPAKALLLNQGFKQSNRFDIFDGGPIVESETTAIAALNQSVMCHPFELNDCIHPAKRYLIANCSFNNFKAILKTPTMTIHDIQSFFDGDNRLIYVEESCHA